MTTYHVTTTNDQRLMLRDGTGTDKPILARMPNGTNVELIGEEIVNNWFHVRVNIDGQTLTGWAFGNFLKKGPAPAPQPHTKPPPVHFPLGTLGMNIPKLAFYGTGGAPDGINQQIWLDQKDLLNSLKVKVVRFFVQHLAVPDYLTRVGAALTALGNMQAILCLTDVFSESGCILKQDDDFYDMPTSAGNKLHPRFYIDEVYAKDGGFLDYVFDAVTKLSSHSNILYWEIGNELTVNIPGTANTKKAGECLPEICHSHRRNHSQSRPDGAHRNRAGQQHPRRAGG